MTPDSTWVEVLLPLIKLRFLRHFSNLEYGLQSILLTLVSFYVTFQHVILIHLTFDSIVANICIFYIIETIHII